MSVPAPAAIPSVPRAEFTVVPAELADPGILDRIPHRTRVRRVGNAWLRADEGDPARTRHDSSTTDILLPVIGETRDRIRVAFEDDDARLALWIARDDTWASAAIPVQLTDASGRAPRDAGVFVHRGAPLVLWGKTADGTRREVQLPDDELELRGHLPEAVIANVWVAAPTDPPLAFDRSFRTSWTPPPDLRTRVKLLIGTKIRTAPDNVSPVIAVVDKPDVIGVIANNLGDYRGIEIARPHARVRGFVRASELSHTTQELVGHGSGTGSGFGMSHADKIAVPAGTCLFDRADGEVVGVQLVPTVRLGRRGRDATTWSEIHIGTSWTIATVYVHDLGDDPTQPRWESCTQPVHR